jgi:AraC family transcriptional regulator
MNVKDTTRSFYEAAVERAVRHLLDHLDDALGLPALARQAALSPFHFHRVFRGMVGETPLELHRRLRLERAAMTLSKSDAPVTTIAFDAGYETHEAFTRAFRQAFGDSPSGFRQEGQRRRAGCERAISCELPAACGIHAFHLSSPEHPFHFAPQKGHHSMNVVIETLPELRVATVRHVGPYNRIGEAFARLSALAGPAGLFGPDSKMIGIYHDDPETTPAAELRSEAGLSVPPGRALPPGLTEVKLPAGRYAHTVHEGAYEGLGDTWSRLMGQWLPAASGVQIGPGASFEVYRNTPADVPADQLRTELYLPIASNQALP